jgi:hypothetical protein
LAGADAGAVVGAAPVVGGDVGAMAVVGLHAASRAAATGKLTLKPMRRKASRRAIGSVSECITCPETMSKCHAIVLAT